MIFGTKHISTFIFYSYFSLLIDFRMLRNAAPDIWRQRFLFQIRFER